MVSFIYSMLRSWKLFVRTVFCQDDSSFFKSLFRERMFFS